MFSWRLGGRSHTEGRGSRKEGEEGSRREGRRAVEGRGEEGSRREERRAVEGAGRRAV